MEQAPQTAAVSPYHEIDNLIDHEAFGEPLREALRRAVDDSYGLPPHQQLRRLLEINERAIYLDYPVRAGVQSSILDTAMDICDVDNNPDAGWRLHVLQIRALSRDFTILQPDFYPVASVGEMRRDTVQKLRGHAKAALKIMSRWHCGDKDSHDVCCRVLATFPEFTT